MPSKLELDPRVDPRIKKAFAALAERAEAQCLQPRGTARPGAFA